MRPVKGVVTGQKGSTLVIKLESGKIIHTSKKPALKIGKPVLVYYDFTQSKVRDVKLEVKDQHLLEIAAIEKLPEPEINEGEMDDSVPWFLDSGALPPFGEGCWEFHDPDIVELEMPDTEPETPEFEE